MAKAFRCLNNIPDKKTGSGAVICLAKECLPLTENVWTVPVYLV
jgi:hypothetical protein